MVSLNEIKASDMVADFLKSKGIDVVFGIIGSANSHIFDSINKLGYTRIINTHHEQAAVLAMGAYYRVSGKLSASIVTAGAGASNAITGVVSNWADSIPGIIISGNESSPYLKSQSHLRMYGTQGFNVVKMVKGVTKYSTCVLDVENLSLELQKCHSISLEGRPGPCWIDIPFDIQALSTKNTAPLEVISPQNPASPPGLERQIDNLLGMLKKSSRPLVLGGHGVRLSNSGSRFKEFISLSGIPTVLTWSAIDLLNSDDPLCFGRFGLYGQRCANFLVQNCDLLLVIGSRLALPQVGYDAKEFARGAEIVIVDIEDPQFSSGKIVDHIKSDCSLVLDSLVGKLSASPPATNTALGLFTGMGSVGWSQYCQETRSKYPAIEAAHKDSSGFINSYRFIDSLSSHLKDDHIIVTDMGTALLSGHQAIRLKESQRMFTSLGLGEMGYGLPGALGAAAAFPKRDVLCLNCDGGIMMNIQELHTLVENGFNVKIIIFNNDGYLMIKHTQKMLFKGAYTSVDKSTGIGLPDFEKVSVAFGYKYYSASDSGSYDNCLSQFINTPGAAVLEVFMDPEQEFCPKVKGVVQKDKSILAPPLEEMSPLLPMKEVQSSMISPLSTKSKLINRS